MRAIDTNVLVRLLTRDETKQAARADEFIRSGTWVSVLALVEAARVLAAVYERSAQDIATAIDMLLNHEQLTLQDADIVAAALKHFRGRPALGFSDCMMLELARKAGHLPLDTFDRTLGSSKALKRCDEIA